MSEPPVKAVALLSGGLDSMLAVKLMTTLGVDVTALTFMTHFGCSAGLDGGSCGHDPHKLAETTGFKVKLCHLGKDYIDMVRQPKFGRGKNMNPCVDCRIMMLRAGREYMEANGGEFAITGEVLGQRPMSQRLDMFNVVDRESGLVGRVLRPLSAKLLRPTIPETEKKVDRSKLLGISGRGRKDQMRLAAEWGIKEYPTPSGGCLLTDPHYSDKLRDLFIHLPIGQERVSDIQLLQIGRHLRVSDGFKLVVGRDHEENELLETLVEDGDWWIETPEHRGPLTIGRGTPTEAEIVTAARPSVRYGKAPKEGPVRVLVKRLGHAEERTLEVDALPLAEIAAMRVENVFAHIPKHAGAKLVHSPE